MSQDQQQESNLSDEQLDALLDEALEDFSKPNPPPIADREPTAPAAVGGSEAEAGNVLTEDLIKEATTNFEASMRAIMAQQQTAALGQQNIDGNSNTSGVPELQIDALSAQFSSLAQSASKAVADAQGSGIGGVAPSAGALGQEVPDFGQIMAETMQRLSQNNQQFHSAPSDDELSKLLSGMGLGSGSEASGLFPLMQTMLENILTKEVLYPPIKEIVDKYPEWLANNRDTVDSAEFDRYSRQFDAMKKVVDLFDSEKESDSDEVKGKRFEDLLVLMQNLQAEGHPPPELAGDMAAVDYANMMNPSNGGAGVQTMPDFSAMFGNLATAPPSTAGSAADPSSQINPNIGEEQCSIM